jgi:predicted esterase
MAIKTFLWPVALFAACWLSWDLEQSDCSGASPVRYPANAGLGFHFPYYLHVPSCIDTQSVLVVEPNNTGMGSDEFSVHDVAASNLISRRVTFANEVQAPFLVPVFPRPYSNWWFYTHALDRDTLAADILELRRLDLQLIAMIDDARSRLTTQGTALDSQIFILGFSASGMFANRFAILHPTLIKAAAVGSPGGWPIAPVSSWSGEALRFNVGVADLQSLTGTNFNAVAYRRVPHYFFIGDQDTNDSVPFDDSYDAVDRELVNRLFGDTPVARWPQAQAIYAAEGCAAEFVTYPGVGHNFTSKMLDDVKRFFYPRAGSATSGIHAKLTIRKASNGLHLQWLSFSELSYILESSADLQMWNTSLAAGFQGTGCHLQFSVPSLNNSSAFYRIQTFYRPPGDGEGRFFFLNPVNTPPFTITCAGLFSGPCQTSVVGPGIFAYSEENPSHANLMITLNAGGVAHISLVETNPSSGTFHLAFTNGASTSVFDGTYQALRSP